MNTDKRIDDEHKFVRKMRPVWRLIRTLLGGTPDIIASGEENLPRRKYENDERYESRLKCATLLPAFEDAVGEMVGRAFSKPMEVENLPSWYVEEVLPNVDLEGNSLANYVRAWLHDATAYGLSHTLVESPSVEYGSVKSLADQKKMKLRPYYVLVQADAILNWKVRGGVMVWLVVRLYDEDDKAYIREYMNDDGTVTSVDYEETMAQDKKRLWAVKAGSEKSYELDTIPLVTLYTDRKKVMEADPPLRELAYMNRKHYATQSGIDALVDVASVPILALIGDIGGSAKGDDEGELEIGANTALQVGPGGDIKYVEHSGRAIGTGTLHLEKLEDNMRRLGARMLVKNVGMASKTKNEADEDMTRENSPMSVIMGNLVNAVVNLVNVTQMWRRDQPKPIAAKDVKLNPNLHPNDDAISVIKALSGLADTSKLSAQTVFEAAKLRGMIPEEVTWVEEKRRIREDMSTMVEMVGPTVEDPTNDED
jgi:hypothetical protein